MCPEKQESENFEKSQQKQNIEDSSLERSQVQQVQIHLGSLFNLGSLSDLAILIILGLAIGGFGGLIALLIFQRQLGLTSSSLPSSPSPKVSINNQGLNQGLNQGSSANSSEPDEKTSISADKPLNSYGSGQSFSNNPFKFITDSVKGERIGFTLIYPGRLIRVTDIRISVFLGRIDSPDDYAPVGYENREIIPKTTLRLPTKEDDYSPHKERLFEAQGQEDINLSIIDEEKTILVDKNTSFMSEFGTHNFINVIDFSFRFKLIYIDRDEEKDLFSDSIYYFYLIKDGYSAQEIRIEEILKMRLIREGLNPECLKNVSSQDSERLFLLRHLRESYSVDANLLLSHRIGNNIFDFLLNAYINTLKECKNKEYSSIFLDKKLMSHFANSEDEFSKILQLIQDLNDTDDSIIKLNLIEVLIEKNDRRVIPHAQSFIRNNADKLKIDDLKEKLKKHGLILDQEE